MGYFYIVTFLVFVEDFDDSVRDSSPELSVADVLILFGLLPLCALDTEREGSFDLWTVAVTFNGLGTVEFVVR